MNSIVTRNTTEGKPKHRRNVALTDSLNTLRNLRLWRAWQEDWKRRRMDEDVREVVEEVEVSC
jgi:hypothetical protein